MYWLLPSNPKKFDINGALIKFGGFIDWTKKNKIKNDDVIYLYESDRTKAIIAKFVVVNDDITKQIKFKDEEFWKCEKKFGSDKYFRMQLITHFDYKLSIGWLKANGLKSNIQSAEKIEGELLENIRLIEFANAIEEFPKLIKSPRDREFKEYSEVTITKIIIAYLIDGKSHRDIDKEILYLDSNVSKGYKSMGILHYLGLTKEHKGIFRNMNIEEAAFVLSQTNATELLSYFNLLDFYSGNQVIMNEEIEAVYTAKEGRKIIVYTNKYERIPKLREEAIRLHGLICIACGFNFEKQYGELGKDFIEIHHVKPLYLYGREVEINPLTDLLPVCSNCHRMIHRKRNSVLSIEELQEIINTVN